VVIELEPLIPHVSTPLNRLGRIVMPT
jgi:hypothetical protein